MKKRNFIAVLLLMGFPIFSSQITVESKPEAEVFEKEDCFSLKLFVAHEFVRSEITCEHSDLAPLVELMKDAKTFLRHAIEQEDFVQIRYIYTFMKTDDSVLRSCGRCPAISYAAWRGKAYALKTLLACGERVDTRFLGLTPLHFATKMCHSEAVKILLDHGAEMEMPIFLMSLIDDLESLFGAFGHELRDMSQHNVLHFDEFRNTSHKDFEEYLFHSEQRDHVIEQCKLKAKFLVYTYVCTAYQGRVASIAKTHGCREVLELLDR